MDVGTPGSDFSRLMQYGAVGVVAAGLLTLVVAGFWLFLKHALEQNKTLLTRHDEMQEKHVEALRELVTAIHALKSELSRDIGHLFNELSAMTEGSKVGRRPRS
jgi:hypothetical protein